MNMLPIISLPLHPDQKTGGKEVKPYTPFEPISNRFYIEIDLGQEDCILYLQGFLTTIVHRPSANIMYSLTMRWHVGEEDGKPHGLVMDDIFSYNTTHFLDKNEISKIGLIWLWSHSGRTIVNTLSATRLKEDFGINDPMEACSEILKSQANDYLMHVHNFAP